MPENKLHKALRDASWYPAQTLLASAQGTRFVREEDEEGNLPLHVATCNRHRHYSDNLVLAILDHFDAAAGHANEDGNLPIHIAVSSGCPVTVVKAFLDKYPEGGKQKNKHGDSPLVLALQCDAPSRYLDVIKLLLEKDKRGLRTKLSNGRLPVHVAARNGLENVAKVAALEYPEGLKHRDNDGNLAVHIAAEACNLALLGSLAECFPWVLSLKDDNGNFPLHVVVKHWPYTPRTSLLRELKKIAEEHPEAFLQPDIEGNLPIHSAIEYYRSDGKRDRSDRFQILGPRDRSDLIQILVEKCPQALEVKNKSGSPPLHLLFNEVITKNCSIDLFRSLVTKHPECCKIPDKDGNLLIHLAVLKGETSLIKILAEVYPPSLVQKNNHDDSVPLHLAICNGHSLEVLKLVCGINHEAMEVKNRFGNLPIHLAVHSNCHINKVKWLVECYPDCLCQKNESGDLPIHVAAWWNTPTEIIAYLAEKHPDGLSCYNNDDKSPVNLAIMNGVAGEKIELFCSQQSLLKQDRSGKLPIHVFAAGKSVARVKLLARKCPRSLTIKDRDGDLPIHIAAWTAKSHDVVKFLATEYPAGIHETNAKGLTPIICCSGPRLPEYRAKMARLLARIQAGNARNARKDVKTLNSELEAAKSGLASVEKQLEEISEAKKRVEEDLSLAKAASGNTDQELTDLKGEIEATDAALSLAKKANEEVEVKLSNLKNRMVAADQEIADLKDNLGAANAALSLAEKAKKEAKASAVHVEKDLASTKQKLDAMKMSTRVKDADILTLEEDLAAAKKAASESRQSERSFIALLSEESSIPVATLKTIASSLNERLGTLKARASISPSMTQLMFNSFIKDPTLSKMSVIQVIKALDEDLHGVEGNHCCVDERGRNEEGRKEAGPFCRGPSEGEQDCSISTGSRKRPRYPTIDLSSTPCVTPPSKTKKGRAMPLSSDSTIDE